MFPMPIVGQSCRRCHQPLYDCRCEPTRLQQDAIDAWHDNQRTEQLRLAKEGWEADREMWRLHDEAKAAKK